MSYIIKTGVSAEQARKSADTRQTENAFRELSAKLEGETIDRRSADSALQTALDATNMTLDDEIALRSSETTLLRGGLSDEVEQRTGDVKALQKQLDAEALARQNEDTALLNDFNEKMDTEKHERTDAIADAVKAVKEATDDSNALQDIEIASLRDKIAEAAKTQTDNFSALDGKIEAETKKRTDEDSKISGAVADEVKARKDADSDLKKELTGALTTEASDREKADTALQSSLETKIATETQARTAATQALDSSLKSYTDNKVGAVAESLNDFSAPTNTADGTRGFVPAPPKGMLSGILTARGWRTPQEASLTISTLPAQVGSLTFNRYAQSPSWINFDNTKLKISGTTSATDAGTYTATFTPIDLYMWADTLNQEPRQAAWKIEPLKLAKPTAAVTSFTFNNNSQGISVVNFDSTYINQNGDTTATNAGNYSASYSLKSTSNTKWSDGTTGSVVIPWSIAPLKLSKPSASVKTFDYDGNSHTLSVSNYNSTYMTRSGTVTATEVGSYSAKYTLKNTNNTTWTNGTTAAVTITWNIEQTQLTEEQSTGFAQSGALTYNGNALSPTISNFNSKYHQLSGDTSAINAGSYTIYIAPKSGGTWFDGTDTPKPVTWSIDKLALDKPTAATTVFAFDGASHSLDISNYNSAYMTMTGSTSESAAGSYSVTFALNSSNIIWSDKKTADVVINWTIGTVKIPKPAAASTSYSYTGDLIPLDVQNFDESYIAAEGTLSATDAGSYSVTFKLKDPSNIKWSNNTTTNVVINWKITAQKLSASQSTFTLRDEGWGSVTSFVFDGASHDYLYWVQGYNSAVHQLSEDSVTEAVDVGTYYIKITPKPNYTWSDGKTTTKSFTWKITPLVLTCPTKSMFTIAQSGYIEPVFLEEVLLKNEIYDFALDSRYARPDPNTKNTLLYNVKGDLTYNDGVETTTIHIDTAALNDTAIYKRDVLVFPNLCLACTGTLTFRLNPRWNKYEFDDAGNITKVVAANVIFKGTNGNDVTVDVKVSLCKLTANQSTFAFEGGNRVTYDPTNWGYNAGWLQNADGKDCVGRGAWQFSYVPANKRNDFIDDNYYIVTYNGEVIGGDFASKNLPTWKDVGSYTITVEPPRGYCWNNGTRTPKSLTFTIEPAKVDLPALHPDAPTLAFTGNKQCIFASNDDEEFSGAFATDIGAYSSSRTLSDNYTWNITNKPKYVTVDGATCTINWAIGAATVPVPSLKVSSFTFDSNVKSVTLTNLDSSAIEVSGDTSAINAGSYTVILSLKDKTTTCWEDYTTKDKKLTWQIDRKALTATQSTFSQSGALTYNGTAQTVTIANYDVNYHALSGALTTSSAGTFIAIVKPLDNYCWKDGTTTAKEVRWTISPIKLTKPTAAITAFTYDKEAHALNLSGFNTDYMLRSGTIAATDVGSYSVEFKLRNKTNTVWADGTTDDVVINWSIAKKTIAKPTIAPTAFVYDGKAHAPTISSFDSKYVAYEGTASATDAASYYITFTLIDDTVDFEGTAERSFSLTWTIGAASMSTTDSNVFQKVVPTYSGSKLSLVDYLANYNATKHELTGVIEAVDAGTYTAYVAPKANLKWADGSSGKKTISWQITPTALNVPTVSGALTYNTLEQSPTLVGFDSASMTLGGTSAATSAASYSLTFSLKNTTNTVWKDGTTTDKEVTWTISPIKLAVPTPSTISFEYDGTAHEPTFSGFDSTYMKKTGTSNRIEASSNYFTTFALLDKTNTQWADGTTSNKTFAWRIKPKSLPKVSRSNNTTFGYNGKVREVALSNFDTDYIELIDGTIAATDVGDYTATFSLKNKTNTQWTDGTTDDIVINWEIVAVFFTSKPPTDVSFEYDGTEHSLEEVYGSSCENIKGVTGTVSATNVGTYTATYSVNPNFPWQGSRDTDDITITWTITPKFIAKPSWVRSRFTYDGEPHSPVLSDFDEEFLAVSGTEPKTDVGTYGVTFVLKDKTNTKWADGTFVLHAQSAIWVIELRILKKPEVSATSFAYDGKVHTLQITNYDAAYMELTGTISATNVGNYTATISLKDKTNTRRRYDSGATTDDVVINWEIVAGDGINIPTVSPVVQVSKGLTKTHSVTVEGFDSSTMTQSGTVSTNTGKEAHYTVTFSLKDKTNTKWADGTTGDKSVNWVVLKKSLTVPANPTFVAYDGKSHSVTEAVSTLKAEEVGEYYTLTNATGTSGTIKTTITPTDAAAWADGTTAAKTVEWQIISTTPTLSLSESNVTLTVAADASYKAPPSRTVTFTTNSTGYVAISTSNGNIVSLQKPNADSDNSGAPIGGPGTELLSKGKFNLYPVGNGTATITVYQAATPFFKAVTKTITVKVTAAAVLLSWSDIALLSGKGELLNYMRIGDKTAQMPISGKVGLFEFPEGATVQFVLVDYTSNRATFMLDSPLIDSNYSKAPTGDADGFNWFKNNSADYYNADYSTSLLNTRCGEFFGCLQGVFGSALGVIRRSDIACVKTDGTTKFVNPMVWLPSVVEIAGGASDYCKQFEYFANGNSKALGAHYWTRDRAPDSATANVCAKVFNANGLLAEGTLAVSYGFLPCFCI